MGPEVAASQTEGPTAEVATESAALQEQALAQSAGALASWVTQIPPPRWPSLSGILTPELTGPVLRALPAGTRAELLSEDPAAAASALAWVSTSDAIALYQAADEGQRAMLRQTLPLESLNAIALEGGGASETPATLNDQQLRRAQRLNPRYARRLQYGPDAFGRKPNDSAAFAEAVASFQAEHGLTVDGIAGPQTWAARQQELGQLADQLEGGVGADPAANLEGGSSTAPAGSGAHEPMGAGFDPAAELEGGAGPVPSGGPGEYDPAAILEKSERSEQSGHALEVNADAVADAFVAGRPAPPIIRAGPAIGPAMKTREAGAPAGQGAPVATSSGASLPSDARGKLEGTVGTPLDGVRVHTGVESQQAAAQLRARAFTSGQDIHFAAGEYAPTTRDGQWLLAHEVTHTVQQRGGAGNLVQAKPAAGAQAVDPGQAFADALQPEHLTVAPDPILIQGRSPTRVTVVAYLGTHLPEVTHSLEWRVKTDSREVIASGDVLWAQQTGSAMPFSFELAETGRHLLVVDLKRRGQLLKSLIKPIRARATGVVGARDLDDREVAGDIETLRNRVTGAGPGATEEYRDLEWVAHERGLETDVTRNPEQIGVYGQARHRWANHDRSDEMALPSDENEARVYAERLVAANGIAGARARAVGMPLNSRRDLVLRQVGLLETEANAFLRQFREAALSAGNQLLDESVQQIVATLQQYGLARDNIEGLKRAIERLAENLSPEEAADILSGYVSQGDLDSAAGERTGLREAAEELLGRQRMLDLLIAQREDLKAQVYGAVHHSGGGRPDLVSHAARRDAPREDGIVPGAAATPSGLPPASSAAGTPDQLDTLRTLGAEIQQHQQAYQVAWLVHELAHPILAAFRDGRGRPQDLERMAAGGDRAQAHGIIRAVAPKLRDIARTRRALGNELSPLELPPVVELTKRRLHVPPGTARDGMVNEAVSDAMSDWKDWAIAAVTVGLAVLTAIPTGGSSLIVAAEVGALALDMYLAYDAVEEYRIGKAAANTNLDQAKALAMQEPSLTWLAVQLVGLPLGAAAVTKTFREAIELRRIVAAGKRADDAVEALNRWSSANGLDPIGTRIANDRGSAGAAGAEAGGRRAVSLGQDVREPLTWIPPEPGYLDVIVHGRVDEFVLKVGGAELSVSHRQLARLIQRQGGKFQRIRLLSCRAGMHPKGAAQHLANKLGVEVKAPSDRLIVYSDGRYEIGPGPGRDTGTWVTFTPQQSEFRFKSTATAVEGEGGRRSRDASEGAVADRRIISAEAEHADDMPGVDVPSVRDGAFARWFNGLTPDELDEIWTQPKARDAIESRLRHPGKLHEWHLVARAPRFKRWGLTAEEIKELRTLIVDVKFKNPPGRHGGRGSTKAHNEILEIIDTSLTYDDFVRRLRNWAHYRLDGGAAALPGRLGYKG